MNEEELERKRLEMLHNGMWREQQRRKDISKYREEEEQEGDAKDGAKFIKPLLNSVAETDTVESMIRKKAFSNQRSYGAMERSFVRK